MLDPARSEVGLEAQSPGAAAAFVAEVPVHVAAPARVAGPAAPGLRPPAPGDGSGEAGEAARDATVEGVPIDEAVHEQQRDAGLLGLGVWSLLGIAAGLWLVLRWRRTHRR